MEKMNGESPPATDKKIPREIFDANDVTNQGCGPSATEEQEDTKNKSSITCDDAMDAILKSEILQLTVDSDHRRSDINSAYSASDADDDDDDKQEDSSVPPPMASGTTKPPDVGSYRVVGFNEITRASGRHSSDDDLDIRYGDEEEEQVEEIDVTGVGEDVIHGYDENGDEADQGLQSSSTASPVVVATSPTISVPAANASTPSPSQVPCIAEAVTRDDLIHEVREHLIDEVRQQLVRESIVATQIVPIIDEGRITSSSNNLANDGREDDADGSSMNDSSCINTSMKNTKSSGHSQGDDDIETAGMSSFNSKKDMAVNSHDQSKKNRKKAILFAAIAAVLIATLAVAVTLSIGGGSNSSGGNGSDSSSSSTSSSFGNDGENTSDSLPAGDGQEKEFVYVVNMHPNHWCGHNDAIAAKCGGHAASITNQEEYEIVRSLMEVAVREAPKWNITWRYDHQDNDERHIFFNETVELKGVWLGGRQLDWFRNDDYNEDGSKRGGEISVREPDGTVSWVWSDHSKWYDGIIVENQNGTISIDDSQSLWAPGQPDNTIFLATEDKNKTFGEHGLFLGEDGLFYDQNMCHGFVVYHGPGVLRLPIDYDDSTKYPNCQKAQFFLTDDQVVAPPRATSTTENVYVLDMIPISHCDARDRATSCGGHLASITNEQELAFVYELAKRAMVQSPRDARFGQLGRNHFVWTGGMISSKDEGWYWTDGAPWYDMNNTLWEFDIDTYDFSDVNVSDGGGFRLRPYALRLGSDTRYSNATFVKKYSSWRLDDATLATLSTPPTGYSVEFRQLCVSDYLAPKMNDSAAVYRIPFDYRNKAKYPDCRFGDFDPTIIPAPDRARRKALHERERER